MAPNIRNVAIITKIGSNEADSAAIKVATLLNKRKIKVHCVLPFVIEDATPIKPDELKDIKPDLVFAIGGDGTTLRAFRAVSGKVPLFSINSGGHRGILSEIDTESIDGAVNTILAGRYFYDCRIRIQASVNGKLFPPVLNDILIIRVNLTRTPLLSLTVMGVGRGPRCSVPSIIRDSHGPLCRNRRVFGTQQRLRPRRHGQDRPRGEGCQ